MAQWRLLGYCAILYFCRADLDPIYYCELLKVCPIFDKGDATILSLNVTPKAVPKGKCTFMYVRFNPHIRILEPLIA